MNRPLGLLIAIGLAAAASIAPAAAQQVEIGRASVVETVSKLRPGQFVWAPLIAPSGPMLLIVNTHTQRAVLYRNGVPIAASTVSTGKPGTRTPTGVFTVLQKQIEHYSSKYDNAPMPYMQRLTWSGVALHAGNLPGYPASHGCIRMPKGFAKLLYGVTSVGMTVVITDQATQPRVAPTPALVTSRDDQASGAMPSGIMWNPDKSPAGPVSIVASIADGRAVVLRNGVEIGSTTVRFNSPATGTWAYALRSIDENGQHWMRVPLGPAAETEQPVPRSEWEQFEVPMAFRDRVRAILEPGSTIVVTADSLRQGAVAQPLTVLESDAAKR